MKTALLILMLPLACFGQHPLLTGAGIDWNRASSFNPLNVAGLVLAVDASVNVTNTANASPPVTTNDVAGWGDLGPNLYHLIQKGGTNKTAHYLSTGGPTNGPCVFFTNCASGCALTNATGGTSYAQPNTFIMAWFVPNWNAGDGGILNTFTAQTEQLNVSAGALQWSAGGTGFAFGSQPAATNWCIGTFIFNGNSSVYRQNGATFATPGAGTIGSGAMNGITLGNFFNYSQCSKTPKFAQFYWYNGLTDLTTIHNIEKALAAQDGLTIP